jgi:uncharacterized membrane protein YfcA
MGVALALGLGLVAGVVSGLLGIGGGTVFVPALTLALGLGQLDAEATSLAAIVPVVLVATLQQRGRGLVRWPAAVTMGLVSVVGVLAGAAIAESLPEAVLRRLFGALVLLIALRLVLSVRRRPTTAGAARRPAA